MRLLLPNILVDVDGVLNMFDGWDGYYHDEDVRDGAADFLESLSKRFRVVLFTARPDIEAIYRWLHNNNMSQFVDHVTNIKEPAQVYIDDRAITFDGSFDGLLDKVLAFKPHWVRELSTTSTKFILLGRVIEITINESGTFNSVTINFNGHTRVINNLYNLVDEYKLYKGIINKLLASSKLLDYIKEKVINETKV